MEQAILAGLMQRGVPDHIAKGIVANMIAESGLKTDVNEIAPVVPGSRGGYGLNQWTGPRRVAYEKFATDRGVGFDDLDAQLDYTLWELQNTEKPAWDALQGAKTADEATRIYSERFLRPGKPNMDARLANSARLAGTPSLSFGLPSEPTGPQGIMPLETGKPDWTGLLANMGQAMAQPQQQQPGLMPVQRQGYTPQKRDTITPYLEFFKAL
jgi:Phage tail lysozyme